MVFIGPDPFSVNLGRFEFLGRSEVGAHVEIWREKINIFSPEKSDNFFVFRASALKSAHFCSRSIFCVW